MPAGPVRHPCAPARYRLDAGDCRLRLALNGGDHLADLTGRLRCPFGEFAHLVGNDGESAPLFTRPRRLDGRVEGQQIGLIGDLANRLDDAADGSRAFTERAHHGCADWLTEAAICSISADALRTIAMPSADRRSTLRNARGFARILADLIHVFGQLGHLASSRQGGVPLLVFDPEATRRASLIKSRSTCRPRSS
jgi:hypothetical protein